MAMNGYRPVSSTVMQSLADYNIVKENRKWHTAVLRPVFRFVCVCHAVAYWPVIKPVEVSDFVNVVCAE